ncbi:glycosyltransferase 87 family protein [Sciscionella marina]|uniref:glycosyltransferase 87 family protein n=1 Tax=Sciscionella marina TaxID=508770 RepID=UPI00035F665B|nr:glycosyltransferase 87 family protein [Sciscionella marina]
MMTRAQALLTRLLAIGPALWIALGVVELAAAVVVLMVIPMPIDLEVYRLGAQALVRGAPLYHDLPPTSAGIALPFLYPPLAALLFTPLTLIELYPSEVLFGTVSTIALLATLYVFVRELHQREGRELPRALAMKLALLGLPVAALAEPVRENLQFGQINTVLMALVAVDCLALRNTRYRGLLTGMATAVKLVPGAFLLFFLLRRDWRGVLGMVVGGVVSSAIALIVAPGLSIQFWTKQVFDIAGNVTFATNQTLKGFFARLIADETAQNVCWAVSVIALLVVIVIGMRRALAVRDTASALVINAIGGLLISPMSWSHHWTWVAPAFLLLAVNAWRLRQPWLALGTVAVMAIGYIGPFWFAPRDNGAEVHWTVWQQIYGNSYVLVGVIALVITAIKIGTRNHVISVDEPGVPAGRGA